MTSDDKLARMANQIAGFFRSYPDDEAIAGVHDHIVAFWSPAMRRDLAGVVGGRAPTLDPLVVAAFRRMTTTQSPAHKAVDGPERVGAMASDAG